MLEYLQKIVQAQAEGRPLAMISIFFPPEILLSMGLTVFAFEQYTIQLLAFGRGFDYIERGEAFGFSKEACSAHKACVGMAANGIFPTPEILLYTGQLVCDSSAMMAENISVMPLSSLLALPVNSLWFLASNDRYGPGDSWTTIGYSNY